MPVPMDGLTKLEFWQQQWAAFTSAFWINLPLFVVVTIGVWRLRGWMLTERISTLNERMNLAKEKKEKAEQDLEKSEQALNDLRKEFEAYKAEVAAKGRDASPAKVDAAIVRVANVNTEIKDKLVAALMSRENAKKR